MRNIYRIYYFSKHKQTPIKAITHTDIVIQGLNHSEPTAGFDPPIIMLEGIYLNLMLTNDLSQHGLCSMF